MPATIIDVAKLSGYSKATVSRAYASPNCVKPETREKIYAAAKALNYAPNAIARAMVTKQTENIAFIIHEKQYPVVLNPFYSPILEAVLQECNRHGYSAFISTDHDVRLPNGELYIKKHMDGVILAGQTDYQSSMICCASPQTTTTVPCRPWSTCMNAAIAESACLPAHFPPKSTTHATTATSAY